MFPIVYRRAAVEGELRELSEGEPIVSLDGRCALFVL